MSLVEAAIQAGRCSLAVSGDLLRDENMMLALKERGALAPMALSGQAQAPIIVVSAVGTARATAVPNGVMAVVDPGPADIPGLEKLAKLLAQSGARPTIVIVAKQYDQLRMMSLFRGFKLEHVKERGKEWLKGLPLPPAEQAPVAEGTPAEAEAKAAKKAADSAGPRFVFIGRDEELEALTGLLGAAGPICVSGPSGIGKTQLIEHAVEKAGLKRLPDVTLGRGVGADTLFGRLAVITRAGGSDTLAEVLKRAHTPAEAVAAAITSLQAAAGLENHVMVVEGLHLVAGREGDFFRKSRIELLCEALLTNTYPLRIVFTSLNQPVFYREGRDAPLRRLQLDGIKGRFYFDVFQAMGAPEFPRDRFGPMSEKLHGHIMAVKLAAVAIRHQPTLVDDDRFFKMDDAGDVDAIKKQIERRTERLPKGMRELLGRLAHFRYPVDANVLSELGVSRKDRMLLVGEGLLDMVGTEQSKRYAVHSLTRSSLPLRETSDFQTYEDVARKLLAVAASAEPIEKFALQQEANRCLSEARKFNDLVNMEFADYDAIVESCAGLIRSKQPRFDLAAARLAEVLKRDPSNADAHLLKLELMRRSDTKAEVAQEAIQAALDLAAVPEIYHEAVGFYLARNARNKAIKVLEGAIEAMPEISRLRTRLASLLLRQGRRPEAIEHLRTAMEQDPMLPDAYGLLGMARREEGAEKLDEAETLLREAVRLAPRDVVQTSRLVWLLLDIARGVPERAAQVREEVRGLLDNLLQHDKKSWEAHLLYAVALREEGEEQLERARWFLKQARKLAPPKGGPAIRFDVEDAMLELAGGQLDEAEARLRRLEKRDPTNHRVFGALAQVLVRRGQLFAAHAELVRAADRTSPNSLDRQAYDMELARLRGLIQEQAGVELPEPTQTPLEEVQVATDVLGLEEDAADGGDGAEGAPPAEES